MLAQGHQTGDDTEVQQLLYASYDGGSSWSQVDAQEYTTGAGGAGCSADGSVLVGCGDALLLSTNAGKTWSVGGHSASSVAISADGNTLIMVDTVFFLSVDGVGVSVDRGQTFFTANVPNPGAVTEVLITADGSRMAELAAGNIYEFQFFPAPVLNVANGSGGLLLSWVIPSTPLGLQQSTDLYTWTSVTNSPILNYSNLQYQVTLPLSQSQSFYRLKTP